MTPEELMDESERLLTRAGMILNDREFHITSSERDLIASLAMTGHGLAALARARLEAEGGITEYEVVDMPGEVIPEFGRVRGEVVIRRCGHNENCLRHQGHWLHPFTLTVCNMPPSGAPDQPTRTVVPPAPKEAP